MAGWVGTEKAKSCHRVAMEQNDGGRTLKNLCLSTLTVLVNPLIPPGLARID